MAAINGVCAAVRAGRPAGAVAALLAGLERTAAAHFAHENAVMRELLSGGGRRLAGDVRAMIARAVASHVAEHERTLGELREIIGQAGAGNPGGTAEGAAGAAGADLCGALKQWFIDHAIGYDSHLKAIFQAM